MAELERWLEEDLDLRPSSRNAIEEDPWITNRVKSTADLIMSSSPTDLEGAHRSGFDDDFTAFVSAPPDGGGGRDSFDDSFDSDRIAPVHASASYASLGSDFGGEDEEDDGDDEEGLPSQEEIQATYARIFGPNLQSPRTPTANGLSVASSSATNRNTSSTTHDPISDSDVSAFDLTRVLGSLEGMKAEIAGMSDEQERRKAAAKVALGLVYGLERSGEGTEGDSEGK
jgi:hypothetical protein